MSCPVSCHPFSSDSGGLVKTMRCASRSATRMWAAPLVTAKQLTALHICSRTDATVLNLQQWQPPDNISFIWQLKLIDCLRATRWTPPDYWQTDNSNGLVMVICNYHLLNLASQVLILTCFTPLVQTGDQFFTVWPWPWPLTYDPDLQSQASQGQGQTSCEKSRLKVKRFKQESAQMYYRPCYAVDNKQYSSCCHAHDTNA